MFALVVLIVILVFAVIAMLFSLNGLFALIRRKVPYVNTPRWALNWLAHTLPLSNNDTVYDLGCGDARVLIAMAKTHPGVSFVGLEMAWWPYTLAKMGVRNVRNVNVFRQDFYRTDLSRATVIFCFLLDRVMPHVAETIARNVRPGTRVVSYGFRFAQFTELERISNPDNPSGSKLYLYQV